MNDYILFFSLYIHLKLFSDEDLQAESHMKELISEYVAENSQLTDIPDLVLTQNQVIIARSSEYDCWLRATVVTDVSR